MVLDQSTLHTLSAKQTVYVNDFTDSVLDPSREMEYKVKDGGHIVANTTPGCWGPMLTPALKGGHEVTKPVYVEGAEVGDAIAVRINSIDVTSMVTASGNDAPVTERFNGDPFIDGKCPGCHTLNPETEIKDKTVRCLTCGAEAAPFAFTHAYTIAFDENKSVGVTLDEHASDRASQDARAYMTTPENSVQNPVVAMGPSDMPGTMARIRPFLGQLGTTPSRTFPDSHNAGDFGQMLIDAPHDYSMTKEQLEERTDGHMDINKVRPGAVVLCPVKVEGGGVYMGDMHAMQGAGEIAGHTTDVSGIVNLKVDVIKNAQIEGPVILPVEEDLPHLAKPFTEEEKAQAQQLSETWHMAKPETLYPITFVGSGATLNDATTNGMERAAALFGITVPEVMNRATINGAIEIGRNPGIATVTLMVPESYLREKDLLDLVARQYNIKA